MTQTACSRLRIPLWGKTQSGIEFLEAVGSADFVGFGKQPEPGNSRTTVASSEYLFRMIIGMVP